MLIFKPLRWASDKFAKPEPNLAAILALYRQTAKSVAIINSHASTDFGISGQDGSYLAESLLKDGFAVHGLVRRSSLEAPHVKLTRISAIMDQLTLHPCSLESQTALFEIVREIKPDYLYHLGAQSFVSYDIDQEYATLDTNLGSTHALLSAVMRFAPHCHVYFAASSEMFGHAETSPQNESTPFNPRSV